MNRRCLFVGGPLALSMFGACSIDVGGSQFNDGFTDSASVDSGVAQGPVREESPEDDSDGKGGQGDAVVPDGAVPDAEPIGGPSDAGASGPSKPSAGKSAHVVDGETAPGEWEDALWSYQRVNSDWGPGRNELRSMALAVDADFLWLRVEGALEFANAIVVYVDSIPGSGLAPSELTDRLGTIDDAISCNVSTPRGHAPDFAWGTRVTDGDGLLLGAPGWRRLDSAADLGSVDERLAPSVCKRGVCETRISRASLFASGVISVFARLVNATGDLLSNQGLPVQPDGQLSRVTESMQVGP